MKSDLEIAQAAKLRPILDIAEGLGLEKRDLEPYGWYKAKVHLDVLERIADRPSAKYIDITAITPTPLGEGKTTTMVGLSQALGSNSASGSSPASASLPWVPRSGSRVGLPEGVTPRSSPWRTSIFI